MAVKKQVVASIKMMQIVGNFENDSNIIMLRGIQWIIGTYQK